ncbi:oligosaccharide flippase family protein [Aeromonas caviae]
MEQEFKEIIKNATYLTLTKGITYIFPVFMLGYLVKTLSIESFGKYSIALTIGAYAQVIVDYGFSLTASREVAKHRGFIVELSRIYFETTIVRVLLGMIVYPFYYIACSKFIDDNSLLVSSQIAYAIVIGNTLFPVWFFQGIEKLGSIMFLNVFGKLISLALIFIFVKEENDVTNALLVQAIPLMIVSVVCNFLIINKYIKINGVIITMRGLLYSLKDGWSIFLSSISSVVLTNSAILILSSTTTPHNVGLFAAAERLAKAISGMFAPITQAIYPYNCRKFSKSIPDGLRSVKRTGVPFIFLSGFILACIYLSSDLIGFFLNMKNESIYMFNIFLVWLFFGVVNNVLGIQILCSSSHGNAYSKAFIICASISMVLIYILCIKYAGVGAVIAITLGEVFLMLLLLYYIKVTLNVKFIYSR